MRTGSRCGDEGSTLVISAFLEDEGGYTTVAVALALLLSLTLVFAAASAGWVGSRSAEVQHVADAAAMAGSNAVAGFSTIVQVVDACALSLGLTGIVVLGAGLVASCVPGLAPVGAKMCETGARVLDARTRFVDSAKKGVEGLEAALPAIVVANSAACVAANSTEGLSYAGCALPFPMRSGSDFSALESEVDDEGMGDLSERMRDASREAEDARSRAQDALERGWYADCGSSPYSLYERSATLAHLSSLENPYHASPDTWGFGVALSRARSYYAARLAAERVQGSTPEQLTDSACRRAFYEYALDQMLDACWVEQEDGSVYARMPELPRNAAETRDTRLYTDRVWPCTDDERGRTLHAATSCPGATGAPSGTASLEQVGKGLVAVCPECGMDVGELGRVASASTSIANGFEHHWRLVVDASREYVSARGEWAEAERRVRSLAEEGEQSFDAALDQLSTDGPTLLPPGAWGCVSVVVRDEGASVPEELTASFLGSAELSAGAAISAATLAPDEHTEKNNVLASFFDSFAASDSVIGGSLDGVLDLWGSLLVGYGSACEGMADAGGSFLDDIDGVMGGTAGAWLRDGLKDLLDEAGFAPVDMRLRKPVLVNSQDVLGQSGYEQVGTVRELVSKLPDATTPHEFARSLGLEVADVTGGMTLTIAELEIPGVGVSIPLTIDLGKLGGFP